MQRIGVDLLSTIARSGFSHPLSLSPTLVALTASPDAQLSAKAFSTLSLLHQKHASLLATRFLEPAKSTHAFVAALSPDEPARGFRGDPPDSMLGRWYALLHKEKRQVQLDYLRTLSRAFEVDLGASCDEVGLLARFLTSSCSAANSVPRAQSDVSFARFLAEALSTLDYKRTEEPLVVISYLNSALAVSGLQVLHALEQGLAGGGGLMAVANANASPSRRAASGSPVKVRLVGRLMSTEWFADLGFLRSPPPLPTTMKERTSLRRLTSRGSRSSAALRSSCATTSSRSTASRALPCRPCVRKRPC